MPLEDLDLELEEAFAREDEVLRRGPRGAPVYDKLGYELDYQKIARSRRPVSQRYWGSKRYLDMLAREAREGDRKAEILAMDRNQVSAMASCAEQIG